MEIINEGFWFCNVAGKDVAYQPYVSTKKKDSIFEIQITTDSLISSSLICTHFAIKTGFFIDAYVNKI